MKTVVNHQQWTVPVIPEHRLPRWWMTNQQASRMICVILILINSLEPIWHVQVPAARAALEQRRPAMESNVKRKCHRVSSAEQKQTVTTSIKVLSLFQQPIVHLSLSVSLSYPVTCESCKAFFRRNALKSTVTHTHCSSQSDICPGGLGEVPLSK